jgi:hypothetical protein
LLEDVIKNTPECHPDKSSLKEALEQIDAVAWHINEQLREHENNMKMVDIQKSLCGGFPKIIAPGRKLLKQGNLMKVPRAGGSSGQARYFVLFSDMIMYCKIKSSGNNSIGTLALPKSNALECGCMLPLKHCKVATLVGKGVFKLSCQKEELILYSNDGSQSSEEWVNFIIKAIAQHKSNSATLRKESSRREPVKRPDIMKMRRESLGQILLLRRGLLTPSKHKMILRERGDMSPGNSPIIFSPRRSSNKRKALPLDFGNSPNKSIKIETAASDNAGENENNSSSATPKRIMGPPPVANVQLRAKINKRINRSTSAWKTLSMSRKDKLKNNESQIFRSPSIYENNQENQNNDASKNKTKMMDISEADGSNAQDVMTRYLSGKICPLTPSQQPTNISHLVVSENPDAVNADQNTDHQEQEEKTREKNQQVATLAPNNAANYCSIM